MIPHLGRKERLILRDNGLLMDEQEDNKQTLESPLCPLNLSCDPRSPDLCN